MRDAARLFPALLAAHPRRAVAIVLAVTALFGFAAREVRLDNNFAALFATDSPESAFREEHRARWGPDDGLLVASVKTANGAPLSPEVVDLVDRLTTGTAAAVPALGRVESITTAEVLPRPGSGAPLVGPAFGPRSPYRVDLTERVALARRSTLGAANLVSEDGRILLVVGNLKPQFDSYESVVGPAEDFRSTVERITAESGAAVDVHFGGVAYTRIAAIELMQSDLIKLVPLAALFMAIILWVLFRRVAAVVVPLVAIGCSVVITAGVVGLAGDDLNQVTIIFPILIMGVVVSGSTHLVHRYYRERALGASAAEAGALVWERLTGAAFVACTTTAIGFASLAIAKMEILHEFGLYLAAGVAASCFVQILFVPAALIWSDSKPSAAYYRADRKGTAEGSLTEQFARTLLQPRVAVGVLLAGVAVCVGSVAFARTATYDYAVSDMLDRSHPVAEGNAVIDEEMAGGMPVEIALTGARGDFRRPEVLARVDRLAQWLQREDGIRTMGLPMVVREVTALRTGPGAGQIPTDAADVGAVLDLAATFRDGEYLRGFTRDDWSQSRLQGFTQDRGARYVVDLRRRFEAEAHTVLAGTGVTARLTGEAPVGYEGMNEFTRELVESTLLALVLIVLAVLALFRNGWLALISVLPNVFPILLGLALYRTTSDTLDPLPGVVLCIAIGLAADDTIHLMNRWRELRRLEPDRSDRELLVEAVVTVRRAMVFSSITLIAGFSALMLSSFSWNRQFGFLGSVVLGLALLSDLVFGVGGLSLLARRYDRQRARKAHVPETGPSPVTAPAKAVPVPADADAGIGESEPALTTFTIQVTVTVAGRPRTSAGGVVVEKPLDRQQLAELLTALEDVVGQQSGAGSAGQPDPVPAEAGVGRS